jgi:hypothetical protein
MFRVTIFSGFSVQVPGSRFQVSVFRFQVPGFSVQVPGFSVQVSGFSVQVSVFRFQVFSFSMLTSDTCLESKNSSHSILAGQVRIFRLVILTPGTSFAKTEKYPDSRS